MPKNQSLVISGLRSSRNLSVPPTLIRAGNLECTIRFWTLGVKPDPMVPHTWGLGHPSGFPRGGSCCNIYKDIVYDYKFIIRIWEPLAFKEKTPHEEAVNVPPLIFLFVIFVF